MQIVYYVFIYRIIFFYEVFFGSEVYKLVMMEFVTIYAVIKDLVGKQLKL